MAARARNTYGRGSCVEVERGKRYRLRWVVGHRADGSAIQKTETFAGTVTEARDRLAEKVAEARVVRGMPPVDVAAEAEAKSRTVGDVLLSWLGAKVYKASTFAEYRRLIDVVLIPALGTVPVLDLRAERLERLYATWSAEGLATGSVKARHRILSAALARAERLGWIPASPMRRVAPLASASSKVTNTPTPEQAIMLITRAQNEDQVLYIAVTLALATGARRGELAALRWSDVDLDTGRLSITRNLTDEDARAGKVGTPKSAAGTRVISLADATVATLKEHAAWQAAEAKRNGARLAVDPYLLTWAKDAAKPPYPNSLTHAFRRICDQLARATKEPYAFRFHDLRHFQATALIAAGIDPVRVAARLGHADPSITLRVYSHAQPESDRDAAEVVAALTTPRPALTA